ncbi:MAG: hypothetical protein P8163_11030 [Candidatus Thiodiazotropha sp.]
MNLETQQGAGMKSYSKENPLKSVTITVSSIGLLITFAYFWHNNGSVRSAIHRQRTCQRFDISHPDFDLHLFRPGVADRQYKLDICRSLDRTQSCIGEKDFSMV